MRVGLGEGLGSCDVRNQDKKSNGKSKSKSNHEACFGSTYDCLFNVNRVGLCVLVGNGIAEDFVPNFEALDTKKRSAKKHKMTRRVMNSCHSES